jgi:hypothetical protein
VIGRAAAAAANLVIWPAGRSFVRCYDATYAPLSLNPTPVSMRFRPVFDPGGDVVPTAYGGEDGMIALAETAGNRLDVTPG